MFIKKNNTKQPKSIIKHENLRRSKRLAKKCSFHQTVTHSDGTQTQLKSHTIKHIRRIFNFPNHDGHLEDSLHYIDRTQTGHFHQPPSLTGNKITHIAPVNTYNRTCMCNKCSLQISQCRQLPCNLCIRTSPHT